MATAELPQKAGHPLGLRTRLIGGLVAVVGAVILAASSQAWAYGPGGGSATISATVSQSNGITTLNVTGSGYGDDETVNFIAYYPTSSIGATTSSATGMISASFTLPAGFSAGTHSLTGTGSVSGNTGTTTFTLAQASAPQNPCPSTTASVGHSSDIVLVAFHEAPCLYGLPAGGAPTAGAATGSGGTPSLGTPNAGGAPSIETPSAGGSPSAAAPSAVGTPSAGAPSAATPDAVGPTKAGSGRGGFTVSDQVAVAAGAALVCGAGLVMLRVRRRGTWTS